MLSLFLMGTRRLEIQEMDTGTIITDTENTELAIPTRTDGTMVLLKLRPKAYHRVRIFTALPLLGTLIKCSNLQKI